jgi:uncharacterized protein
MAYLQAINLRPIKSARILPLKTTIVQPTGLYGDSQYVLVDGNNKVITLRDSIGKKFAHAQIKPHISNHYFKLGLGYHEEFTLPFEPDIIGNNPSFEIDIFKDKLFVKQFAMITSEAICAFLGERVKLCMKNNNIPRTIQRERYLSKGMTDANCQDGYTISVITTGTIESLMRRHKCPIDLNRLRVNLIINDSRPHIEDTSEYVTINGQQLRFIESIPRCPVINVNPNDGQLCDDDLIKTFSSYRLLPKAHKPTSRGIMMGAGYTPTRDIPFQITIGDEVFFH